MRVWGSEDHGKGGALWAVVVFAAFAACSAPDAEPVRPAARPNLILLSIDTLRADRLGCYGYERPTSPNLDRLAASGALFERATANSPWTLPSHASMLTGLFPKNHGLTRNAALLTDGIPTLAELLAAEGYATYGLSSSIFVSEKNGLDRGFERFQREVGNRTRRETFASVQTEQAIAWLDEADDRPFFLFWHNYDLHSNYNPAEQYLAQLERPLDSKVDGTTKQLQAFREGEIELTEDDFARLNDLYDAEILELDSELGRFFDHIRSTGLSENTYVVITSDHGEEFGDHGGVLHGRTLYQELVHVPLIVAGPGMPAGHRVEGLVQLSDLFATLLELGGAEAPPGDGASLVPAWEPARSSSGRFPEPARLSFAEADHRNEEHDIKRAVRLGDWKLLFDRSTGEHQLFDLADDPGETQDLSEAEPELAERLLDALDRYLSGTEVEAAERVLTEAEIETLRSLGYLD